MGTATLSIRLDAKDKRLITDFANFQGCSISSLIRDAVMEKIEDSYDIAIADKAYEEYLANPVTYSLDEVGEELGLS
jgi:uncharacterized protein (DUF1778 family)